MIYGGTFDYENKVEELEEVVRELEQPEVWNDPERAQGLGKKRSQCEAVVDTVHTVEAGITEAEELLQMADLDNDQDTVDAVLLDIEQLETGVAKLEFQRMFSGEMDANNAFLDIQSGSGGTEAQDWAEMILRMYLRWGEMHGFGVELIEVSAGEVAGIKSATIKFDGDNAFGLSLIHI